MQNSRSSHTRYQYRQLEAASTLLQHVTDVPFPVASHFAQRVVDWATMALRTDHPASGLGKRKRSGAAAIAWSEAQRTACWVALHNAFDCAHAVNASPALWAAVEHALRSLPREASCPPRLPHITAVVTKLCTGDLAAAAQPSPEQLVSVVVAAVGVLGDGEGGAATLLKVLLLATAALLQGTVGYYC